jgi:probable phosphoglycerate mutase
VSSLFPEPASSPVSKPDAESWVFAHCDGGARGNPGPAGYGAVLQDGQGHVLAELSEFLGIRTNNYAEYSGLLGCLQWTLDHGHRRLRVVSDSELMVKQIQGKYKVNSPDLKPMWEEARRRIRQLDGFEISHALRHKNKVADRLANDAMDRGMGKAPGSAATPIQRATPYPKAASAEPSRSAPVPPGSAVKAPAQTMLRGFTRDGTIHLLGGATLPDGVFVKVIPE